MLVANPIERLAVCYGVVLSSTANDVMLLPTILRTTRTGTKEVVSCPDPTSLGVPGLGTRERVVSWPLRARLPMGLRLGTKTEKN